MEFYTQVGGAFISLQYLVTDGICYIMNVPSSIPRLKLVSCSLSHSFLLLAPVNKESLISKSRGVYSLYVRVSQLRKNNSNMVAAVVL